VLFKEIYYYNWA